MKRGQQRERHMEFFEAALDKTNLNLKKTNIKGGD